MHMQADPSYERFFLQPTDVAHRRYEALRAVFVEQQPLQQVAQQFGVAYGTLRNWASSFRGQWDSGEPPPFSSRRSAGGPPRPATRKMNQRSKSRMLGTCRWR
jgi:transposase-like protein